MKITVYSAADVLIPTGELRWQAAVGPEPNGSLTVVAKEGYGIDRILIPLMRDGMVMVKCSFDEPQEGA